MHSTVRWVSFVALAASFTAALVACTTKKGDGGTTPILDASNESADGARPDAALDAGAEETDSASDAAVLDSSYGPGEAGAACSFNRECQAALRCECDGTCECRPGARGMGRSGLDACDSGNACSSSVCLEGPDGGLLCSGECMTAADCSPKLPRCEDISFVGQICVREP